MFGKAALGQKIPRIIKCIYITTAALAKCQDLVLCLQHLSKALFRRIPLLSFTNQAFAYYLACEHSLTLAIPGQLWN